MFNSVILSPKNSRTYLFLTKKENFSKFQGFYVEKNNNLVKIIDFFPIKLKNIKRINENKVLLNNGTHIEVLPKETILKNVQNIDFFDLDVRHIYNFPTFGRDVKVIKEKDKSIVHYKDNTGINCKIIFEGINLDERVEWIEKNYEYDKERNSLSNLWIFRLKVNSMEKAIRVKVDFEDYKNKGRGQNKINILRTLKRKDIEKKLLDAIFRLATIKENKIRFYAGQPWFFQIYSRDELISISPLIKLKFYKVVKGILDEHYKNIQDRGRLIKLEGSKEEDADSIFYLIIRSAELIRKLKSEKKLSVVEKEKLKEWVEKGTEAIFNLWENFQNENLIFNFGKETWQDTCKNGFCREGYRLEIQSLFQKSVNELIYLNKKFGRKDNLQDLKKMLNDHQKSFKKYFVIEKKPYVVDGLSHDMERDMEVRPNLFLALYFNENIIAKHKLNKAINIYLKELWLDWGGLASVSKSSEFFEELDTGEDNKAYHFGDSWYWINAIAAIVLKRLDRLKYEKYIVKIKEALENDFFNQGAYGSMSEISSAIKQEARGCFNQLWSNAMFLEFLLKK